VETMCCGGLTVSSAQHTELQAINKGVTQRQRERVELGVTQSCLEHLELVSHFSMMSACGGAPRRRIYEPIDVYEHRFSPSTTTITASTYLHYKNNDTT